MNKRIIVLLLLSFAAITTLFWYNNSYQKFEPIGFKNGIYTKAEIDSNFYKNLRTVLDYYKVSYKINQTGMLMIKREARADNELIWNYTTKALDTDWIQKHISN